MKANVESQTFNGVVDWYLEGSYIKLLTAAANLKLECLKNGRIVLLAPAVKRGFYQRIAGGFDQVRITNTGSQLVEFLTAPEEGGSDALTGAFDITSPLGSDNADGQAAAGVSGLVLTLDRLQAYNGATYDRLRAMADNGDAVAAIALGLLRTGAMNFGYNGATWDRLRADAIGGAGALRVTERGFAYGASFDSLANINSGASETVLAAASNTNGVIVWEAQIQPGVPSAVPGQTQISLNAHTAAPAAFTDGDVLLFNGCNEQSAAGNINPAPAIRDRPILIAAGKGLFFRNSGANNEASNAFRRVLYTIL